MAFSVQDMLERLGLPGSQINSHSAHECFREEAANIRVSKREEVAALFPNVTLSDSNEIVYAPFRLCHSLPKINLRGRCFTPTTLANSFGTARDALVNIDHQMSWRKGVNDTICGHIVCGRFDPDGKYQDEIANVEKFTLPKDPIPMLALAAFHLRSKYVPDFLEEHLSGKRKWHTSMECSRDVEKDNFYYRGEFIPLKDAEDGMRECVSKLSVKPYKGHTLALAVGGPNGNVDFHSAALTPSPADADAKFMAFVTKEDYVEAANSGMTTGDKTFFFPLETKVIDKDEVKPADMQDELANIAIMGKTEPTEDGHAHDVLNDGTIVPLNGHTHYLGTWAIARGTTPRFTGRTDTHTDYYASSPSSDGSQTRSHMHLIDIPLRGKTASKETEESNTGELTYQEPLFPLLGENDMTQTPSLNDVLSRVGRLLGNVKAEGQQVTELASLRTDLEALGRQDLIKNAVKTEIASMVEKGELIEKPKHDEAVTAAVKVETDKHDKEKKETELRTARREKVLALGMDLESKFNEKLATTVGEYINTFTLDDAGDKAFDVALATLETISAQQKELAEKVTTGADAAAAAAAAAATPPVTETTAANAGKKPATPGEKVKKKFVLVGAGGEDDEAANLGDKGDKGGKGAAAKPTPGVGRGIFSTPA